MFSHRLIRKIRVAAFACALLTAFLFASCSTTGRVTLAERGGQEWRRGVTHFHTLWSDGNCPPEVAVAWYKDNGYDFAGISDHNILATGERWFQIDDEKKRLPSSKIDALKKQFGNDWPEIREKGGQRQMRLKTINELVEHFNDPGTFLLIPGEEVTSHKAVHVNAINIRATIQPSKADTVIETLRENFDRIDAHADRRHVPVLAHINHPNWSGFVTAEEIVAVGGERFFEVYNGVSPGIRNQGDPALHIPTTDLLWDIILTLRFTEEPGVQRPMYGVGTDDTHQWYDEGPAVQAGRGWVMVLSKKLTPEALIAAMKAGRSYTSSGVTLDRIDIRRSKYRVYIDAEEGVTYTTQFIGTPKGADTTATPIKGENGEIIRATHAYNADVGKILFETTDNPATYNITGDELYVRAKVISSKPKLKAAYPGDLESAWTQPIALAQQVDETHKRHYK